MRETFDRPRVGPRAAVLALVGIGLAACSGETSRFSNPFASKSSPETTGAVAAAPVGQVEQRPLPQQHAQLPPPPPPHRGGTLAPSGGSAAGAGGIGSYQPTNSEVTGSVAKPQWNWEGGTAVVVGPGETIDTLSRKYGVPAAAILQANNITNPAYVRPGQQIVIPRYNTASVIARPHGTPLSGPPRASTGTYTHTVEPSETLILIARHYHKSLSELAAANRIPPYTMVKIGERIVIPGYAGPTAAAPAPHSKVAVLDTPQQPKARMAAPQAEPAAEKPIAEPMGNGTPSFRWPVRGRVITGFGPKPNGQQNDGINLAVPEGTAIRAADDGVVAYAGSELKGYGNLVLVRHTGGFVTAYAHASEITVKRGDEVRRGQVIAKAGQSGNVTAPQLHFEIRKGSSPVDPMQYLPGA
jgi:murein DD-endopeptidase MepM/ murein hydrolase activator NlpD